MTRNETTQSRLLVHMYHSNYTKKRSVTISFYFLCISFIGKINLIQARKKLKNHWAIYSNPYPTIKKMTTLQDYHC